MVSDLPSDDSRHVSTPFIIITSRRFSCHVVTNVSFSQWLVEICESMPRGFVTSRPSVGSVRVVIGEPSPPMNARTISFAAMEMRSGGGAGRSPGGAGGASGIVGSTVLSTFV